MITAAIEPHDQARRAFDGAALWYDQLHATEPAFRTAREFTQGVFMRYFPPHGKLLELNAGTGLDAVFLVRQGMKVLATDLSAEMTARIEEKRALYHIEELLETRQLGFGDLHVLDGQTFDGAYSNFGGLNCTERLGELAEILAKLLPPGAHFIATVMPDFCLWESLSMLLRLKVSGAFRRVHRSGIEANLGGISFKTYYYSPKEFFAFFKVAFTPIALYGLNVVTPPLNHFHAYRVLRPLLPVLTRIDHLIAPLPGVRRIGDHFVAVLRRNGT